MFNVDPAVADLPEQHQKNIADGMLRLFGTPAEPQLRTADPDAEEPEEPDEESEEDSDEESEETPLTPLIDLADSDHLKRGGVVYNARCAGCHGVTGDGAGPAGAHLRPRPRDYRKGIFKFTSTPYGNKPARHDLIRTIRRGAKGTSMPAFPWMSEEDLNAVIDYVMYLSDRGEVENYLIIMSDEYFEDEDIDFMEFTDAVDTAQTDWADAEENVVLPLTAEPRYDEESVVAGRTLFLSKGCASCHGVDGKGQTEWINPEFLAKQAELPEDQRIKINYDAWEEPAPAADLTAKMLHGGRRPIDIYRRIYTGINGTPMPAFDGLFAAEPESIWHLVHYVRHVIEGGDPTAGIESLPPEEAAEAAPDDAAEAEADSDEADSDDADSDDADSGDADSDDADSDDADSDDADSDDADSDEADSDDADSDEADSDEADSDEADSEEAEEATDDSEADQEPAPAA